MTLRLLTFAAAAALAVAVVTPPRPLEAQSSAEPRLAWEATLKGDGDGELRWPVAVAPASSVEVAVADAFGPRLVLFTAGAGDWTAKRVIELPATPRAVAHDGRRYLVSLRGGTLAAFEPPDFEARELALPAGTVPAELAPSAGGGVWLHDVAGARILALDAAGNPGLRAPIPDHLTALAAAPGGGFYAAFAAEALVRRYGAGGDLLATWSVPAGGPVPAWPDGLVAEVGGELIVTDRHAGRIIVLDAGGRATVAATRRGWEDGELRSPSELARLPDGRLAVVDHGNGRVQIFRRIETAAP